MSLQKQFQCFALLALCLGCAQLLFAQGTDLGTIRGLVTDSSGAVIPNAKVTILDLGTNTTRETATNARGEYQMFGLRSGNYKVSISAPGLTTQDITGVVLNGSDVVSANATLRVAGTHFRSQLWPTTGCPSNCSLFVRPRSACVRPLSRTWTLGDFTSRLPTLRCHAGKRRTSRRSTNKSR